MSEIDEWFFTGHPQKTRAAARFKLVPTHVRNADVALKAPDLAGKDAQAVLLGGFFARSEQRLQSQADSEKGYTRANAFDQCVANLKLVERAHHLAEVAHAR